MERSGFISLEITAVGNGELGEQRKARWTLVSRPEPPAHCLPALLPHALFLEHSFELPFPLLIVEPIPGLPMARNRRKRALAEGREPGSPHPAEETERSSPHSLEEPQLSALRLARVALIPTQRSRSASASASSRRCGHLARHSATPHSSSAAGASLSLLPISVPHVMLGDLGTRLDKRLKCPGLQFS